MNFNCDKHNHQNGCACPPVVGLTTAPAGSSVFGSYANARPVVATVVVEREYRSVDDLPQRVQDALFTGAMRDIAEERFGTPRMNSHQYSDLYDEVAEQAEAYLNENYDEVMYEHELDDHQPADVKETP